MSKKKRSQVSSTWRLPIALVYRSTADWYLPVLKATFPSSLVFSAIAEVSSDGGVCVGVVGGGGVDGAGVRGGGVCARAGVLEPDPDAWLSRKSTVKSRSFYLKTEIKHTYHCWHHLELFHM